MSVRSPVPLARRDVISASSASRTAPGCGRSAPGRQPAEVVLERRQRDERRARAARLCDEALDERPEGPEHALLIDAEDGAQDHVERDRLHLAVDGERPADLPAFDHADRALAHQPAVDVHALAVERRAHQAALLEVALAVEHENRVPADERAEDLPRRLARPERVTVAGEDVPDPVRVAEHDHLAGPGERGHRVAIPEAPCGLDGRVRSQHVLDALEQAGSSGAGRKGRGLLEHRHRGRVHRHPPAARSDVSRTTVKPRGWSSRKQGRFQGTAGRLSRANATRRGSSSSRANTCSGDCRTSRADPAVDAGSARPAADSLPVPGRADRAPLSYGATPAERGRVPAPA
jgi:hypothetical protein